MLFLHTLKGYFTIRKITRSTCKIKINQKLSRQIESEHLFLLPFDENIVFLAPSDQENFCSIPTGWHPQAFSDYYQGSEDYKFLILNGFNTKDLYLDKYESPDGDIFIFLAEDNHDPDDPITIRKIFMEEKYENEIQ